MNERSLTMNEHRMLQASYTPARRMEEERIAENG